MNISVSRYEIRSFNISYSNLVEVNFVFNSFTNFSRSVLLPVHIKNMSSINLRYISENVLINGYINFLSKWSIKMFAYEGAQIAPMAQPFICKQYLQLKIKFNVSINAKNVVITFVEAVRLDHFSKDVLTDLTPSAFGMLVYNDFTSRETRYELSGIKSIWLIFLRKSVVCWTYDGISLTIG